MSGAGSGEPLAAGTGREVMPRCSVPPEPPVTGGEGT